MWPPRRRSFPSGYRCVPVDRRRSRCSSPTKLDIRPLKYTKGDQPAGRSTHRRPHQSTNKGGPVQGRHYHKINQPLRKPKNMVNLTTIKPVADPRIRPLGRGPTNGWAAEAIGAAPISMSRSVSRTHDRFLAHSGHVTAGWPVPCWEIRRHQWNAAH